MTNLLPLTRVRHIRFFYLTRFVKVFGLLLAGAAVCALLSLAPALWVFTVESRIGTEVPNSFDAATRQKDRLMLISGSGYIDILSPIVSATTTPSEAIAHALALRPHGIVVDHIAYTQGTITLGGSTLEPALLDRYRLMLLADPLFPKVAVPVDALVGASNGRFTLTISRSF